jgi:hypothetical protein
MKVVRIPHEFGDDERERHALRRYAYRRHLGPRKISGIKDQQEYNLLYGRMESDLKLVLDLL